MNFIACTSVPWAKRWVAPPGRRDEGPKNPAHQKWSSVRWHVVFCFGCCNAVLARLQICFHPCSHSLWDLFSKTCICNFWFAFQHDEIGSMSAGNIFSTCRRKASCFELTHILRINYITVYSVHPQLEQCLLRNLFYIAFAFFSTHSSITLLYRS